MKPLSERTRELRAEMEEEFYTSWHPDHGTNMRDMLIHKLAEAETQASVAEMRIVSMTNERLERDREVAQLESSLAAAEAEVKMC